MPRALLTPLTASLPALIAASALTCAGPPPPPPAAPPPEPPPTASTLAAPPILPDPAATDAGTPLAASADASTPLPAPAWASAPFYRGPPLSFRGFDVAPDGKLKLKQMVRFELDAPGVRAESDPILEGVVRFLETFPRVTLLRIEAHPNETGLRSHNVDLARARSRSVAAWLVAHGVDCHRLLPVSFPSDFPPISHVTRPDRRPNRRIELRVALVDGAAPYGPPDGGGELAGDPCAP